MQASRYRELFFRLSTSLTALRFTMGGLTANCSGWREFQLRTTHAPLPNPFPANLAIFNCSALRPLNFYNQLVGKLLQSNDEPRGPDLVGWTRKIRRSSCYASKVSCNGSNGLSACKRLRKPVSRIAKILSIRSGTRLFRKSRLRSWRVGPHEERIADSRRSRARNLSHTVKL
jgi:hypothetical protein